VRVASAAEAAAIISDGATVAIAGSGGGILEPDALFRAVRERFEAEGSPRDLTLVHALGIGHPSGRGLELWADPGLVRRVIGGHWSWSPTMQRLVEEDRIEAYAWPAGVISLLLREIAAGRPGLITRTGLHTYVDPRNGGGRANARTTEELVELIELEGAEHLRFRPFRVDVGLIRGSFIDGRGNVSCEHEPARLDVDVVARAARRDGGRVIAQVREQVPRGALDPWKVVVPAVNVDVAVLAPDQWQTYGTVNDPEVSGAVRARGAASTPSGEPAATGADGAGDGGPGGAAEDGHDLVRGIVSARAANEVRAGERVNVGFGMSADVVPVLARTGRIDDIEFLIEQGTIGGIPLNGGLFGASRHFDALFSSPDQFDLFASGILDRAFLGMAEVDGRGDVNVSHVGGRLVGPGGFIEISQSAHTVVFCGSFTVRGLELRVADGALKVVREGTVRKFVDRVRQTTFSGPFAVEDGRSALYVTERCVLRLAADGVQLVEVVEGIDVERDVLAHMGFEPVGSAPRVVPLAEYLGADAAHQLAAVSALKEGAR
jgi:propionate CoA-transferase